MLAILGFATSCIQVHQQFTINPDHSARVRLTLTMDPDKIDFESVGNTLNRRDELDRAERSLEEIADRMITAAEGVDAWTDYAMEKSVGGKVVVTMTGYIPDLSKYRLYPEDSEGFSNLRFHFDQQDDKQEALTMQLEGINDAITSNKKPKLSPDEIQDHRKRQRKIFASEARETKFMLDPLRITAQLRLPGPVTQVSNFTKPSPREVQITFQGHKLYSMLDLILTDDALAKQAFANGWRFEEDIPLPGDQVNEFLFGKKAPLSLIMKPATRPLFDYAKELDRAKRHPISGLEP